MYTYTHIGGEHFEVLHRREYHLEGNHVRRRCCFARALPGWMQDVFLSDGSIPTDFRYADWLTTVPLMAVTFAVLAGRESFTDHRLFSLPGMSVPGIIILGPAS